MTSGWSRHRASSNFWTPEPEDIFMPVLNLGLDRRMYDTITGRAELSDRVLSALPPDSSPANLSDGASCSSRGRTTWGRVVGAHE